MAFPKMKHKKKKHIERRKSKKEILLGCGISLLIIISCFLMLEFSSGSSLTHLTSMKIGVVILNCLTIGILWGIVLILTNRMWISNILCSILCGIIAVVNHYVLIYHGMPLSFLVIKNFATAMNVASAYSFSLDSIAIILILAMLVLITTSLISWKVSKGGYLTGKVKWIRNIAILVCSIFVIGIGYCTTWIKPISTISWLWSEAYHSYGYAACTLESAYKSINGINKPDGYSNTAVNSIEIEQQNVDSSETPDIILILNETFYDLNQITDIETDVPYMQNIQSMDNLLTGYAITPSLGGGTNNSEYELLTSNSLQLMPGVTPFNFLDLTNANSIVSYVNALGYDTTGSHSEAAVNYSRGQGYSALGFQKSYFDEDFLNKEYYYNRWYETDENVYDNLIRWYEESPEDSPRFQYLLTIQNHGGWDLNDSKYDIVHTQNDYGANTELVNEYLTGIYLSDQAFKELTDYFSEQDRPVIVCMVGDHCPTFAADIVDAKYTDQEQQLLLRKVPLLIWANYDLEEVDLGTMSMNYVIPTLLEIADMKLSSYYSYMLQLKEQVPILTAYGYYYDINGNIYKYDKDESAEYESLVDDYFYLEYNNLQKSRKQELFTAN